MSQLEASSSAHAASNVSNSLVCGRCRRKTPSEASSKLCHACGVPLHPSCSDDVAARECGLAFGFTAPAAFCSRRCYDSDLLASNQQQQEQQVYQTQQQQQQHQKRLPHVPNEITAALTIKIGDVSKTSRKHVSVTTFRFLLSEGFEVFRAKANSRTARELQQHANGVAAAESYSRDDRAVYIKPGVHSKQAELVELTEKNFEARIARSYRNFLKRKPVASSGVGAATGGVSDAQFECDIFTYVRKDSARRKQLALSSGGVKSTSRMHTFMEIADQHSAAVSMSSEAAGAGSNDLSGAASASHKRKHAQLSDSSTGNSSSTAASFVNSQSESSALQDPNQDPAYKTVRMLMNGQVVPVKVNVRDLLACFGMVHAVATEDNSMQEL